MMTHYHYEPERLLFLVEADQPMPGFPFALQCPPAMGEHQVARAIPHESADPALCAWEVVEDWRGVTVYDSITGNPQAIEQLGPLPHGVQIEQPPPRIVSMRQARLALLKAGLLVQADAAIASMPGEAGDAARIDWEYSTVVDRLTPLVRQMSHGLSLTEADVGELFSAASKL